MNSDYQTIEGTELEDFNNAIIKHGHAVDSYTLKEFDVEIIPMREGSTTETGKITIRRGSIERTYNTGWASKWPAEFAIDISNGVFDR